MKYPEKQELTWRPPPQKYLESTLVEEIEIQDGDEIPNAPEGCYLEFEKRYESGGFGYSKEDFFILVKRRGPININYDLDVISYEKYQAEKQRIDDEYEQAKLDYVKEQRRLQYETLKKEFGA